MKNLKSIALALVVVLSTLSVTAQTKKVDASKSSINWVGKKVTGQHNGTVNLKDGKLVFKGKKLAGGSFTVDMTSLTATDLQGEYQGKLNGHLKADDFFGTEKFPVSKIVITGSTAFDKGTGVVKGAEEFPFHLIHSFDIEFQVIPGLGVGHHIPAQGVGSVLADRLKGIHGVAQAFRHLVAVLVEHQAIADNVFKGNGIK